MPAGQRTLVVHLNRPVRLPYLERQCTVEDLSRLVLGHHEEMQREAQGEEAQGQGAEGDEGTAAAEAPAVEASTTSGATRAARAASDAQPFVLPLGVIARNEEYPRSCTKWCGSSPKHFHIHVVW